MTKKNNVKKYFLNNYKLISIENISKKFNISLSHAYKIMRDLRKEGIAIKVKSKKKYYIQKNG